jgi:hypothetical protein
VPLPIPRAALQDNTLPVNPAPTVIVVSELLSLAEVPLLGLRTQLAVVF